MTKKLIVLVKPIAEVPADFVPVDAAEGTAAWPYLQDVTMLESLHEDPNYLGSFIEPYGYLSLFRDGSSVKTEIGPDGYCMGEVTLEKN